MSTTYAGSDAFPNSLTVPSDGDTKPVASVLAALQGLANRTRWLYNRTLGAKEGLIIPVPLAPFDADPAVWLPYTAAGVGRGLRQVSTSGNPAIFHGPIVMLGKLISVTAYLRILTGGGNLPDEQPELVVQKSTWDSVVPGTNGISTLGSAQLAAIDKPSYEGVQTLVVSGLSHVFDFSARTEIFIDLSGEYGTTSSPNRVVLLGLVAGIDPNV